MSQNPSPLTYVLITSILNEQAFIEKAVQSVIQQTVLPDEMGDRGRRLD